MKKLRMLLVNYVLVCCVTSELLAVVTVFTSDAVIQEGDVYPYYVEVYDTPPDVTTIEMTGGIIMGDIDIYDNSTFNIFGGTGSRLNSYDNSTVNINSDWYTIFEANNQSKINLNEGIISNLDGYDQSIINVTGGQTGTLSGFNESVIHLSGGLIMKMMFAEDSSIINIYGYDFHYEPFAGHYGNGQLTGFWSDATAFSIDYFSETTYDHVILRTVPEPSTVILLGLGGLLVRRKRKK